MKDFREVAGGYFQYDIEVAKELLAEAGYPDGKELPPITLIYNQRQSLSRSNPRNVKKT